MRTKPKPTLLLATAKAFLGGSILFISAALSAASSPTVVESVYFETRVTPPATRNPEPLRGNEPAFRLGLAHLPESLLVTGALSVGGGMLGLSTNQAATLLPLVTEAYASIATDPSFTNVPSALP